MSRITVFVGFLFLFSCTSPDVKKINLSPDKKASRPSHILVTIDGDRHFYIGNRTVDSSLVDSFLTTAINEHRPIVDTPTIIINADTSTLYGDIFRIIQIAKKGGAKVIANIR